MSQNTLKRSVGQASQNRTNGYDSGSKNSHRYRLLAVLTADLELRKELTLSFLALIIFGRPWDQLIEETAAAELALSVLIFPQTERPRWRSADRISAQMAMILSLIHI